ncbi:DUF1707 domain-containing protein [Rhodococcus sp. BP-252]|nr:DUF1707 domain-containing protein [Rhodococcus sp. BP-320]MBY6418080.1 DUF1707 domain-containing protein [Rhodococcus sp. BP-321]MBY6428129.1 DUF1707 domain-containing protein [Rhodococcus sp. BP-323]MBY6433237.1 DUF1707 domain-containing protein [Rhodococcus sp. BP-322]MBY6442165.1 DUF1707 domain-containing protein [Rhodococcus sp. BP-319]MBY6451901.1 DUF1707 domain-containing protein [Rhodococcus sp. BP-315]MBY6461443.1 DUF1707 domain-containing protein [Rhodococcus sp. BP-260]MBY647133
MRASDADRSRVVRALEREVGTGRLTLGEYSDRVAAAYGARTLGELAAVTRDLPTPPPAPPTPVWQRRAPLLAAAAAALVGLLAAFTGSPAASAMTAMMPGMGCG